jgi:hypothetical protein
MDQLPQAQGLLLTMVVAMVAAPTIPTMDTSSNK